MRVTVYLNESDDKRFNTAVGAALHHRGTFLVDDYDSDEALLEEVFAAFNSYVGDEGEEWFGPADGALLRAACRVYRANGNRSLSVGDVVLVHRDTNGGDVAYACENAGWSRVELDVDGHWATVAA